MKKFAFALLFFTSLTFGQQNPTAKQASNCMLEAEVFKDAASMRDGGLSPQQAYSSLSVLQGTPKQSVKHIINLVYFDERFQGVGGKALYDQVYDICLYPKGHYTPLE
ncbi:hypothetical protein BLA17378_04491 [Burkholderia aenigmatica]|uniref:Uncharacterized protein n=1 Tax=Burkholderia aenigmatica TaxID=2015348 RepID=A0ABY6XZT3_9BURK|nr:hypothetical protein [Burkholderia aenigmatica]VWC89831.1 hypothetical protein BLA17378_04491 [Burkholderia aenigmatica]